jgi:hypothetical protein
MTEATIICPSCKIEIKLTESLAAPLIEATRREYQRLLGEKDAEIRKREQSLSVREEEVQKGRESIDMEVAHRLQDERQKIAANEARKAKLAAQVELNERNSEIDTLQEILKQKDSKLADAHKVQTELSRKARELEEAKRDLDLTVERRIKEEVTSVREEARARLEAAAREHRQRLEKKDASVAKQEESLLMRERAVAKAELTLDERLEARMTQERAKIVAEEGRKAKQAFGTDLDHKTKEVENLQEILREKEMKLAAAQKAQADVLRKERELEDAKREMELTVERRIHEALGITRDEARKEVEEQMKLKVMEKEHTITSMQKQIEELRRKAEQGSQQLQGEVQELAIEALLGVRFPRDTFEPIPKGVHGGDTLQRIVGPLGKSCGTILWEYKRTKNWSDAWLPKLRGDQRAAKAEVAVIVSQALPAGVETFELIDGVWVLHPRAIIPVAVVLREMVIEVACARQASEGQQTKTEMVYEYLTGPRFRQRVQAIVEAFSSMKEDLEKEKAVITRQWAKRDEQIEHVMQGTVGMYGDLQGIAGKTLQEIEGLELKALNPIGEQD